MVKRSSYKRKTISIRTFAYGVLDIETGSYIIIDRINLRRLRLDQSRIGRLEVKQGPGAQIIALLSDLPVLAGGDESFLGGRERFARSIQIQEGFFHVDGNISLCLSQVDLGIALLGDGLLDTLVGLESIEDVPVEVDTPGKV